MLVLSISYRFHDYNPMSLISVANEQKAVFQFGQMYGRIYSVLLRAVKEVIGEMERQETAESVTVEIVQWHGANLISSKSKPGVKYAVTSKSCTCPDHVYRHKECWHIKAFNNKNALPACGQPVVNLSEREKLELEARQAREDLGC